MKVAPDCNKSARPSLHFTWPRFHVDVLTDTAHSCCRSYSSPLSLRMLSDFPAVRTCAGARALPGRASHECNGAIADAMRCVPGLEPWWIPAFNRAECECECAVSDPARQSLRDAVSFLRRTPVPGASRAHRRLCAAAREYILFETAGGSDGSHKSIAVGGGRGAIVRVARHRASFFFRGVRLGQNRDLAGN